MTVVFAAVAPVFLLIVGGYLLRRFVARDDVYWNRAEGLVYYVLFPTLFAVTLARADFTSVPAGGVGVTLGIGVLTMSAICLTLRPVLAAFLGTDGPAFTSVFQGATRWQTSVALAVAATLFGDPGLALGAVAVVAMTPLLNVMNVLVLARYAAPHAPDWKRVAVAIAKNPFILGCSLGLFINVTRLPIPQPVYHVATALGRAALIMGVLTVGAGLRLGALAPLRTVTWVTTALKLVVMPATAIGLGAAFGMRGTALAVIACCASVPSTSSAYVLARQMGGDAPLMAEIITVQTLFAVVTMPIAIALASA